MSMSVIGTTHGGFLSTIAQPLKIIDPLPVITWPLKHVAIKSVSYHAEIDPGIIIETYRHADTTIHSPVDGKIVTIMQPDGTSTFLLFADDPHLIVILGGIQEVGSRILRGTKFASPSNSIKTILTGDLLGTVGQIPNNSFLLQVAYQPRGLTSSLNGWHLLDPRLFLS